MTISATDQSYGLVFYFRGGLQKVRILNCILNGTGNYGSEYDIAVMYSGNGILSDLNVENCQITGGRSGIWITSPSSSYSTGTKIINNIFSGQYYDAVYLRYHNAPRIEDNEISSSSTGSFYGINLTNCNNDLQVLRNYITIPNGYCGIHLNTCPGTTTKKGLIANNIIYATGSSDALGIYTYNSDYPRIYYNTVRLATTYNYSGSAFYNSNGTNIDVRNNIFSNFGGGYAYYSNSTTAITSSDYNDLYTTGNYLAYFNGDKTDLSALKTASGKDANSISINPVFVSANDLHTTSSYLDNKGTNIAAVTTDIDGESRSGTTPDIGADEFIATTLPLSGIYTIGGTSPDYATFSLAAVDLNNRGVSGPVTFNVRSGGYTEHFELFDVPGASATNTIIFQSESGDSTSVILSYNATATMDNSIGPILQNVGLKHATS